MKAPTTRMIIAAAVIAGLTTLTACSGSGDADKPAKAANAATTDYGLAVPGTITAGVPQGDAPFVSPDPNGKPFGMLVDLNDLIAKRMGLKIVYNSTTVSAGLPLVTSGRYDMMIADLTMSDERKKNVDFTEPFYVDANDVVVSADSSIKDVADLDGKRVGAGIGSAQFDFATKFLPKAQLVSVVTNASGLDQLLNGNLDGFVLSSVPTTTVLAANPGKLKVGVSVDNDIPEAMAVNKKLTAFKAAYNKQLAKAIDDGTFLKLYTKYFPGVDYPSTMFKFWPSLETQVKNQH